MDFCRVGRQVLVRVPEFHFTGNSTYAATWTIPNSDCYCYYSGAVSSTDFVIQGYSSGSDRGTLVRINWNTVIHYPSVTGGVFFGANSGWNNYTLSYFSPV